MSDPGGGDGLGKLRDGLERIGPMVVAFSGGADSAFLAWVATDTLGPGSVRCVTAVSPSLAPEERADCRRLADRVGPVLHRGGDATNWSTRRTRPMTAHAASTASPR